MQQQALFRREGPVAGVDEAGRGPLAGPVVAAAVILDPARRIAGLADSKLLPEPRRNELAAEIRSVALAWAVAWSDPAEIDRLNILQATMLAMRRAILGLRIRPAFVQIDGNRLPDLEFFGDRIHGQTVVGGDATVAAISAASILAKVRRDEIMCSFDGLYPGYGFARHKGYGTADHRDRVDRLGPCPAHRQTFRPLSALKSAHESD